MCVFMHGIYIRTLRDTVFLLILSNFIFADNIFANEQPSVHDLFKILISRLNLYDCFKF